MIHTDSTPSRVPTRHMCAAPAARIALPSAPAVTR